MKSISSLVKWILFVPVCLMSVGLTLFSAISPESFESVFLGDRNTVAKIVTIAVLGLFVVCFVLSLFDKKTSPAHLLRKNFACGGLAVLSAMAMAAGAAYEVTQMINSDEIRIMSVITAILAALGGVAMLYVGLNHFSGTNTPKTLSLLYLALPVWCGAHLIDRFLTHTDSPVAAADTMDLVMFVALSMFFINAMMIHALIVGKKTVNSTVNFGLPAVVASLVYGLISIFSATATDSFVAFDLLAGFVYILLGLYVLCFSIELSFKSKTVDEQLVLEDESSEGYSDEYYDEEDTDEAYSEEEFDDVPASVTISLDEDGELPTVELEVEDEPSTVEIDSEDDVFEDIVIDAKTSDADVADELIKEAHINDMNVSKTDVIFDAPEKTEEIKSDSFKQTGKLKSEAKLKGPTTRESVMFEDEDFILSVNKLESLEPVYDDTEDISAFILERQEKEESDNDNKKDKTYVERLDEIDKLIISIQGGDSKQEEE